MKKIVVTIEVEDLPKWEKHFKTHGELYRQQTIQGKYEYTMLEDNNRVVLCAEVSDIDAFFQVLKSESAGDAVKFDGVKPESVQFFVLDKQFVF
ncbi:hypothetical protein [Microbulbifer donghaiensis]|uniref:hypothetical protein n=1 Tax=Microbulbifer donghaiensis TaxID=494016 RepID=UPI001161360D|nr:hypothetical protein [Microbulbifer donghaiensis]